MIVKYLAAEYLKFRDILLGLFCSIVSSVVECLPRMREIGVRSPVAKGLSR